MNSSSVEKKYLSSYPKSKSTIGSRALHPWSSAKPMSVHWSTKLVNPTRETSTRVYNPISVLAMNKETNVSIQESKRGPKQFFFLSQPNLIQLIKSG